jgi:hypothetical protein
MGSGECGIENGAYKAATVGRAGRAVERVQGWACAKPSRDRHSIMQRLQYR